MSLHPPLQPTCLHLLLNRRICVWCRGARSALVCTAWVKCHVIRSLVNWVCVAVVYTHTCAFVFQVLFTASLLNASSWCGAHVFLLNCSAFCINAAQAQCLYKALASLLDSCRRGRRDALFPKMNGSFQCFLSFSSNDTQQKFFSTSWCCMAWFNKCTLPAFPATPWGKDVVNSALLIRLTPFARTSLGCKQNLHRRRLAKGTRPQGAHNPATQTGG